MQLKFIHDANNTAKQFPRQFLDWTLTSDQLSNITMTDGKFSHIFGFSKQTL